MKGNYEVKLKKRVIIINPLSMKTKMLGATLSIPYGPLYLSETLLRQGYEPQIVYTTNEETIEKVGNLVTSVNVNEKVYHLILN